MNVLKLKNKKVEVKINKIKEFKLYILYLAFHSM